jgi:hypothetical protein
VKRHETAKDIRYLSGKQKLVLVTSGPHFESAVGGLEGGHRISLEACLSSPPSGPLKRGVSLGV